jgi:hypothetical protein
MVSLSCKNELRLITVLKRLYGLDQKTRECVPSSVAISFTDHDADRTPLSQEVPLVGTSFFWVTSEILSEFPPRPGTAATYKDTESAKEEERREGKSGEAEENGVGVIGLMVGERKKKTRRVLARRV